MFAEPKTLLGYLWRAVLLATVLVAMAALYIVAYGPIGWPQWLRIAVIAPFTAILFGREIRFRWRHGYWR